MKQKNKNAEGRILSIILSVIMVMVVFFGLFGGLVYFSYKWQEKTQEVKDAACKNIMLKEYDSFNSLDVCRDFEGNLHFIEMNCPGYNPNWNNYPDKCYAKKIKVGDVRTVD